RFPNITVVSVRDAIATVNGFLTDLATAVRGVAAVALVLGVIVLTGAITAGRGARAVGAVVLQELGARRGAGLRGGGVAFALLGALASLIAAGLGTVSAWAVTARVFEAPFHVSLGLILGTVLGALVATVGLGLAASWTALSAPPARALQGLTRT